MSDKVWRINEFSRVMTVDRDLVYDMHKVNKAKADAIYNNNSASVIESSLSNAVLRIGSIATMFSWPGVTFAAAGLAIYDGYTSLVRSTRDSHYRLVRGGQEVLFDIYDWFKANPNFVRAEIEFFILEYNYYDGRTTRYMTGNYAGNPKDSYQIKRIQTSSGEWIEIN